MLEDYLLCGKDFKKALSNARSIFSEKDCNKYKEISEYGSYIGFGTLRFGKNSFIIFIMKFNINDLKISENGISGNFSHTISKVELDENDANNIEQSNYAKKNKKNINKTYEEHFEGFWFPKENRLMIYGTELKFFGEDLDFSKEFYNIFIYEKYIIGKRAYKKYNNNHSNPDTASILRDSDAFTENIYLFNIGASTLCFPLHIYNNNILKYINILKNNNHSYSICPREWTYADISYLLNNYKDISNRYEKLAKYMTELYFDNDKTSIINLRTEDLINFDIEEKINKNDIIYIDNSFFVACGDNNIGSKWRKVSDEDIFIGTNLSNKDFIFTMSINKKIKEQKTEFISNIKFSEKEWHTFNINDPIRKHDYIQFFNKNGERKYLNPKIIKQHVIITIDITSITNIKQIEQKFECVFRVRVEWLPSVKDLYLILSHGINEYIPSWTPKDLLFINKHEVKSEKKIGPYLTMRNGIYKNIYYYYYNISFIDKVELDNFPFDVQDLEIELELPNSDDYKVNWIINKNSKIVDQLSEWQYKEINYSFTKPYKRTIHIYVERKYWVYLWRIMFVMSLISLVSFLNISIDPIDNLGDRISYSVTLFLTSIAYSIVTAAYLPILGNQTLMDWYIFHVYIYLGSNMGLISLLPYYSNELVILYDDFIHYLYLLIWFSWHIAFVIRVKYYILPKEHSKLKINKFSEINCDYCGICGLEWKIVNDIYCSNDILYENPLLKNEILIKYEKNKLRHNTAIKDNKLPDNIAIKENKYYELTKYDNKKKCKITRNSYIKITCDNEDIYFKPVCGTRNQIHNTNENYICYLCDNNLCN